MSVGTIPQAPGDAPVWALAAVHNITAWILQLRRGPQPLTSYTVAAAPDPTKCLGAQIYVSNEAGGAVPAFSDGTNWRRVTDRAIIS